MGKSRSELREKAMVILYQIDIMSKSSVSCNIDEIIKNNLEIDNEFVKSLVYGVVTYQSDIDKLANKYMKDWDITRIDKTGAAILRIAIYEIKYTDTPSIVSINEAIELAKKYSDDNVRKIINAVLDKIVNE